MLMLFVVVVRRFVLFYPLWAKVQGRIVMLDVHNPVPLVHLVHVI
jgi:hypothetical protein